MSPILLALVAAVFFGLNMALIKMAIHRKPFILNAIITFFTAAVVIWLFAVFANSELPAAESVPYFIMYMAPESSKTYHNISERVTRSKLFTCSSFFKIFLHQKSRKKILI